jgi:hypothetical protein
MKPLIREAMDEAIECKSSARTSIDPVELAALLTTVAVQPGRMSSLHGTLFAHIKYAPSRIANGAQET